MPRKTPRPHQRGDESRLRILEAMLALAAERGYDGTSIAAVTEATGLPASSVYWHFKNKDELLAETLEYSYRRWRASTPTWDVDDADDAVEGIRERLRQASLGIAQSQEFWRLGRMLGLENRPKGPLVRKRYPGSADRLARFHLAVMDGLFVGVRANPEWDVELLVDVVAAGQLGVLVLQGQGPPDGRGGAAQLRRVDRASADVWDVSDGRGSLGERLRAILTRSVRILPGAPDFLRIGPLLVLQAREVEPEGRQNFVEVRMQVETAISQWFRDQLDKRLLKRRPELTPTSSST